MTWRARGLVIGVLLALRVGDGYSAVTPPPRGQPRRGTTPIPPTSSRKTTPAAIPPHVSPHPFPGPLHPPPPPLRLYALTQKTVDPLTACQTAVLLCQNESRPTFAPLLARGPLRRNGSTVFSTLIRYQPENSDPVTPTRVDEAFATYLALLRDNRDQLRGLLTLLNSAHRSDWITFLRGYTGCRDRTTYLFTCVNGTCEEHDLRNLQYVRDPFVEDVIGLEVFPDAPPTVLVVLRNPNTTVESVVRIPGTTATLLDALHNIVYPTVVRLNVAEPLLEHLREYRARLPGPFPLPDSSPSRRGAWHR